MGACASLREPFFWGWLVGTPALITAQNLLGVTGGGRSALYWGLLGCAESNFAFCILHSEFCILNFSTLFALLYVQRVRLNLLLDALFKACEPISGFEPETPSLRVKCSTAELNRIIDYISKGYMFTFLPILFVVTQMVTHNRVSFG